MPKRNIKDVNTAIYTKKIGLRLKELRANNNMTQENVAKQLMVNRTTYTKYETGISEMNYTIMTKLVELFNIDFNELLCYDSIMEQRGE
jgi:transcriptional regulator with XRE-family HTH domain